MYESNRQDVIRKKSAEFTTSRNEINVRYKEEIGRINDSIAMVRQLGEKNEDSSVILGTDDCPPSPSSEMRQIHDRLAKLQLEAPIYYNNKLESIKAQHKRDLEEVNQYQNREIAAINQKWDDQISMIQTNDLMQEEQKMMNIQMYESSREDEVERMKTYCQNLTTNHQKREIDEVNSYWNNQLVNIQSDSDMPQNQKELRIRSIERSRETDINKKEIEFTTVQWREKNQQMINRNLITQHQNNDIVAIYKRWRKQVVDVQSNDTMLQSAKEMNIRDIETSCEDEIRKKAEEFNSPQWLEKYLMSRKQEIDDQFKTEMETIINSKKEACQYASVSMCSVCWDEQCNCVLLSCGHISTCYQCGMKLSKCPLCRKVIDAVHDVFF